jgi:hypothetical protein
MGGSSKFRVFPRVLADLDATAAISGQRSAFCQTSLFWLIADR